MVLLNCLNKKFVLPNCLLSNSLASSQAVDPALLAIIGSKGETSVFNKLNDHTDYVLIQQKSQQLAGNVTVPDRVACNCENNKKSIGLKALLSLEECFVSKNDLIYG